jgi:PAS domain S-box-containing protein
MRRLQVGPTGSIRVFFASASTRLLVEHDDYTWGPARRSLRLDIKARNILPRSRRRYATGPEDDAGDQTVLELRSEVARYADIYDGAPVSYLILDRNGVIREANLAAAGLLGCTRSSLAGRRLDDFTPAGMQASLKAFLENVFCSDGKETCELHFVDTDKESFPVHVEANADRYRQTCRVVLCDLAPRQTELSLLDSEERFRLMADSAPILIWIAGPDQRYVWFNRQWLDFTGHALEDERGQGWIDGIHPNDRDAFIEAQQAAFEKRQPFSTEYRLRGRDGGYHYLISQGAPRISASGRLLGYIGSCTDISERRRAEEALQHSRQMLRHLVSYQERVREDERKRIARDIHDDLGQNLLALRIDVSLLHARTRVSHPRLNSRVSAALDYIDATMKAVRATINNLRPAALDLGLSAAIEWQVQDFQRRSGITCELAMADDFTLDDNRATALFRVLQESLNNVIRHSRATWVRIGLRREGARLLMQVADNGIGIQPNCRHKTNSFGLIGMEERINALGGELTVDGDGNRGATLTVCMPLAS